MLCAVLRGGETDEFAKGLREMRKIRKADHDTDLGDRIQTALEKDLRVSDARAVDVLVQGHSRMLHHQTVDIIRVIGERRRDRRIVAWLAIMLTNITCDQGNQLRRLWHIAAQGAAHRKDDQICEHMRGADLVEERGVSVFPLNTLGECKHLGIHRIEHRRKLTRRILFLVLQKSTALEKLRAVRRDRNRFVGMPLCHIEIERKHGKIIRQRNVFIKHARTDQKNATRLHAIFFPVGRKPPVPVFANDDAMVASAERPHENSQSFCGGMPRKAQKRLNFGKCHNAHLKKFIFDKFCVAFYCIITFLYAIIKT